jgi:hypothetical protein
MVPWSEQRITSGYTAGGSNAARSQVTGRVIYTAPGNDTIQIWAANATETAGTVNAWTSQIIPLQVNSSSTQTQQSQSLYSTGLVSNYDFGSSSNLVLSGSSITAINDLGTAGIQLTGTSGSYPTWAANYWNGLGVAQFGASSTLLGVASVPTSSTSWDIFVVCSPSSTASNQGIFQLGRSTGTVGSIHSYTGPYNFLFNSNNTSSAGTGAYYPTNGMLMIELRCSSGSYEYEINNSSYTSLTGSSLTPSGGMNLGPGSGGSVINIGQVLIYSSALSGANQQSVVSWLQNRWGL